MHRLATVREHWWKAWICCSLHNLTSLHITPSGCCHHLKMAAAAFGWISLWQLGINEERTLGLLNQSLWASCTCFTHSSYQFLLFPLRRTLGSMCACVDKLDGLFAYAYTENSACVCVRVRQRNIDLKRSKIGGGRKRVCEWESDYNACECVHWCTHLHKSLWLQHERGKLSIN